MTRDDPPVGQSTDVDPDFSDLTAAFADSLRELSDAWASMTPEEQVEWAARMEQRILSEEAPREA